MNTEVNEPNGADQTASTEANAASAADDIDLEANSEDDTSEFADVLSADPNISCFILLQTGLYR